MVLNRKEGTIEHKLFKNVLDYFDNEDVMVFNDTKVFPARLYGNKEKTGAEIEVFLLRELNREQRLWDVLVDPARKIRIGNKLYFGDDDLFINQIATNDNTTICISKDSFTESIPETKFRDWFNQKRRHVSTAHHYKLKHKIILGVIYLNNLLFWSLAVTLLISLHYWIVVLSLFLSRIILQYIIIGTSSKKFNEQDLIILIPFLEVFLITSQFAIFINNLITKPRHWK